MRVEIVTSPRSGARAPSAATAGEVAAIVAALAARDARTVEAPAADDATGSRWRRAGRVYDAYDVAARRGGRA